MSNPTNLKIPYEIARLCKNPRSAETRHTLRRIYQQKLHEKQCIGAGNAPAALINMPLNDYMKRLKEIQILITRRLLTFTQLPAHEITPPKYNASWMLQILMPKIQIYQYYLIKDHIAEIYLPEYGLILEMASSQHLHVLDEYKLKSLPIPVKNRGTQITNLSNSIKAGESQKVEYYRVKKLIRDICFDTISYWISDKDLYRLLLMKEMDDLTISNSDFKSKLFHRL